jgi:hypothetical protein
MAPSSSEVTLAYSLGFRMTALPAASAGATFHTCKGVCVVPLRWLHHKTGAAYAATPAWGIVKERKC